MNNVIVFLASYLIFFLFLGLFWLWIIDGRKLQETALHAIVSALLSWMVGAFLKDIFGTVRPYVLSGMVPLTVTAPQDAAFPSSHMAATMALAVSVFLHDKKVGAWFMVGSILVGIGRIWAGVHYPQDVVGGAVVGTVVALVVRRFHVYAFLKKYLS